MQATLQANSTQLLHLRGEGGAVETAVRKMAVGGHLRDNFRGPVTVSLCMLHSAHLKLQQLDSNTQCSGLECLVYVFKLKCQVL